MPIDDDRELAEEVEAALKALGIARLRSRSIGPVQRYVTELGGAERTRATPADEKTSRDETDSPMPAGQDPVRSNQPPRPEDPMAPPPTPE